MTTLPEKILATLHALDDRRVYTVAYSGGLDSRVLLHALIVAAGPGAIREVLHVNHGLHADASRWAVAVQDECKAVGVPCRIIEVDARHASGESPEETARRMRYAVLAEALTEGDRLLTAQHQDDQAETLLLQLLRGAGPAGLAGMAPSAPLGAGRLLRPLLGFSRQELLDYAREQGLEWIDDPSNADRRYDRNYLRHEIMPRLRERWPACARTLARGAAHQADAAALLREQAEIDLTLVRGGRPDTLDLVLLAALSAPRQRQCLRVWLDGLGLPPPAAMHLERVRTELMTAQVDAEPLVHWPGVELRRYRNFLHAMPAGVPHDAGHTLQWNLRTPLPWDDGILEAVPCLGAGLRASLCGREDLTVRYRRGGETCQLHPRASRRPLKKLFQEAGVPPWRRDRIPLLYCGESLAAVVGHWICVPFHAGPDEPGVQIGWRRTVG